MIKFVDVYVGIIKLGGYNVVVTVLSGVTVEGAGIVYLKNGSKYIEDSSLEVTPVP